MMKLAVRVDGGPNIGMGHIQRCLALSSELEKNGAEILFISKKDKAIKKKIQREGFEVMVLKDKIDLKEDLKDTINAIKTYRADGVITDSYAIGEHYLVEVKTIIPLLVSIDDLAKISFFSDIVINQNICTKELNYRSLTGKTEFLLGPEYALLREEFSNPGKRKVNREVNNILITLGGADPLNLTPEILKILGKISRDFSLTAIIGPFFENKSEIEKAARGIDKKVEFIYDSHKMSKIMLASDLAISGGGTTLYELAATGTPAISFCLAENQRKNVEGLSDYGTLINFGWGAEIDGLELREQTTKLIDDFFSRAKMSQLGRELVDGRGTQRISKIIENSW